MSKNLTRKGLAFGALVALGSTVIAGTPANAAPSALTIASSYGTSLNTILGQEFNVAVSGVGTSATANDHKLFIEGAVAADFAATTASVRTGVTDLDSTASYLATANVTAVSATDKTSVLEGVTPGAASYTQYKLDLDTTAVTATRTIKVTPFVDNIIADGKPTAGEVKGNTIEITFHKGSEVTATTTHKSVELADTTDNQKATVTLDKNINLEQMRDAGSASALSVEFKKSGAADSIDSSVEWSKSDAALAAVTANATAIAINTIYTAQAYINGVKSGTASSVTAAAGADDITLFGSSFRVESGTGENVIKDSAAGSYSVRTGTAIVAVRTSGVVAKADADGDFIPAAGVPVKVTVAATALGTGSSFTAGGKTVSTAGSSISFDSVTNAAGKVTFDLTATGAKDDKATVSLIVLDSAAWTSTGAETGDIRQAIYTWVDAAAAKLVDLDAVGNLTKAVKAGASYTMNYALADNFGKLYTGSSSRRVAISSGNTISALAAVSTAAVFVDGKASIALTDANAGATASGSFDLTPVVQKQDSVGAWVEDTAVTGEPVTSVQVQTNVDAGILTADDNIVGTVSYKSLSTQDGRVAHQQFSSPSSGTTVGANARAFVTASARDWYGDAIKVSGVLYNTSGSALKGSNVTLALTGAQFYAVSLASGKVKSLDKITVVTDVNGNYEAFVHSNKAGKFNVVVTAGSLSKTVEVEWSAANAADATAFVITAPTTVAPGTTAQITVKLTDQYGNAVKTDGVSGDAISVKSVGSGSAGTIAADTNSDGEIKFNQVIGSNDNGSFKVTATYDADDTSATYAAFTKDATVTIAAVAPVVAEPVSKVGTANGRVYVNVKDGKGSVVSVKIGSKWVTKTALNNDYTFSFKSTKGKKVAVKVYVDGDLSAAKTITVQ